MRVALILVAVLLVTPGFSPMLGQTAQGRSAKAVTWSYDHDGDELDDRIPPFQVVSVLVRFEHEVTPHDLELLHTVPDLKVILPYRIVPAVWVHTPYRSLASVAALPGVDRVEYDAPMKPLLAEAGGAVRARDTTTEAYDGAWIRHENGTYEGDAGDGVRIAIIEGGIDDTHPALDDFDGAKPGPKVDVRLNALTYAAQDPALIFGTPIGIDLPDPLPDQSVPPQPLLPPPAPGPQSSFLGTTVADAVATADTTLRDNDVYSTVGLVDGLPGVAAGDPFPAAQPHATAMAGIAAGTGATLTSEAGQDDVDLPGPGAGAAGPPAYTHAGIAPLANLADVNVFFPAAAAGKGPGFGLALTVAGLQLVQEWNDANPDRAIQVASLSLGVDDTGLANEQVDAVSNLTEDTIGFRPIPEVRESDGTDLLSTSINALVGADVVVVVAAGNGHTGVVSPAAARRALTVGAVDPGDSVCRDDDAVRPESDRSSAAQIAGNPQGSRLKPEIVAPGWGITAPVGYDPTGAGARPGPGYDVVAGTSASAAVVAGMAALVRGHDPDLTAPAVKNAIVRGAEGRGVANPTAYQATNDAQTGGFHTGGLVGWDAQWGFGYADLRGVLDIPSRLGDPVGTAITLDPVLGTVFVNDTLDVSGRLMVQDPEAARRFIDKAPCPPIVFSDGVPLANKRVVFALTPDPIPAEVLGFGSTDANGDYATTIRIAQNVPLGTNLLYAVYQGQAPTPTFSGIAAAASTGAPLFIKARAGIDLDLCFPADAQTGGCNRNAPVLRTGGGSFDKLILGTVHDSFGNAIPGLPVDLEWNASVPPVLQTVRTDAESGAFLAEFATDVPPGLYEVTARAGGAGVLDEIVAKRTFAVSHLTRLDVTASRPQGTIFQPSADASSGVLNRLQLEGTLLRLDGTPLPEADLQVVVLGGEELIVATPVTDGQGHFRATIPVAQLASGVYSAFVRFPGQTQHAAGIPYETLGPAASPRHAFLVRPEPTLHLESVAVRRGEAATLAGWLATPRGGALPDEVVRLDVLGPQVLTVTTVTDSAGIFAVTLPSDALPLGPVTVQASFAGGSRYASSSTSGTLDVRVQPRLTIDAGTAHRASAFTLGGRLADDHGDGIAGRSVQLAWQGSNLGTAVTDADGRFSYPSFVGRTEPLGPALVQAQFTTAGPFDGVVSSRFIGIEAITSLALDEPAQDGSRITLRGRLLDEFGSPVPLATVIDVDEPTRAPQAVRATLELPAVPAGLQRPVLDLETAYRLVADDAVGQSAVLEASFDGKSWLPLPRPSGAAPAASGTSGGWSEERYDLSQLRDDDVRLRLRFASNAARNATGWFVDEVRVLAGDDLLFRDAFNGTLGSQSGPLGNGWTTGGANDPWHVGRAPAVGEDGAALAGLGDLALTAGPDGVSPPGMQATLVSPRVKVPGASTAWFVLEEAHELRPGDNVVVEVRVGDAWTQISDIAGRAQVTGSSHGPGQLVYDLSAFAGQTVQLRLRVTTALAQAGSALPLDLGPTRITAVRVVQAALGQPAVVEVSHSGPTPTITAALSAAGHPATTLVPAAATSGVSRFLVPAWEPSNARLALTVQQGAANATLDVPAALGGFGLALRRAAVLQVDAAQRQTFGPGTGGIGDWSDVAAWGLGGAAGWTQAPELPPASGYFLRTLDAMPAGEIIDPALALALDEQGRVAIDLPGAFPFYGAPYTSLVVAGDGHVELGAPGAALARPTAATPGSPVIAPLWLHADSTATQVHAQATVERDGWSLLLQWSGLRPLGSSGDGLVQLLLRSDGGFEVRYLDTSFSNGNEDEGRNAVVGVRDTANVQLHVPDGTRAAPNRGGILASRGDAAPYAGLTGLALAAAGPEGYARPDVDSSLMSPSFRVPAQGGLLALRHADDVKVALPGSPAGSGTLQVLLRDGTMETALTPLGGTRLDLAGIAGDAHGATTTLFDLDAARGRVVKLRFVQGDSTLPGRPWAIDDATILGKSTVLDTSFDTFLGRDGWTSTTAPGHVGSWQVGPAPASLGALDGVASPSLGGRYANGLDASLVSPTLRLPAASGLQLALRSFLDSEAGVDGALVEASRDDGATWEPVPHLGPALQAVAALEAPGLSGESAGTRTERYDLRGLGGRAATLRLVVAGRESATDAFFGVAHATLRDGAAAPAWSVGPANANTTKAVGPWKVLERDDRLYGVELRAPTKASRHVDAAGGAFTFDYAPPADRLLGPKSLVFAAQAVPQSLSAAQGILNFTISLGTAIPDLTVLHADAGRVLVRGEPVQVNGRLVDDLGNAVGNAQVHVLLNDIPLGNLTTDALGSFRGSLDVPRNGTASGAEQTLQVRYDGDANRYLRAGQRSDAFDVKERSRLVANHPPELRNGRLRAEFTLVDGAGDPLPLAPVRIDTDAGPLYLRSDRRGIVVVDLPAGDSATLMLDLRYQGDETHLATSVSQEAQLPVRAIGSDGTPWLWIGLAVLAALIGAVVALRLRKAPPPAAAVQRALEAALYDLGDGDDVRQGIFRAYETFVGLLLRHDLLLASSDTASEFAQAARRAFPGSGARIHELTSLFEMARYSEVPMRAAEHGRARAILSEMLADLRLPASKPTPGEGTA